MGTPTLFLAGSIEMGKAKDWQNELVTALGARNVTILNPRRDAWDASEQVEWELDGLERADLVAMWFAADAVAPITLLELGLTARANKLVVGCPDGFWRKGNIEVVCARFGIPLTKDWSAFVAIVCARLETAIT